MNEKFARIELRGWRQYARVNVCFHPRLTVITGANASGKSTLISLLASHFGYGRPLHGTPKVNRNTQAIRYISGLFRKFNPWAKDDTPTEPFDSINESLVGKIEYTSGHIADVMVARDSGVSYNPNIKGRVDVKGVHLDSHRPVSIYKTIENIRTAPPNINAIFGQTNQVFRQYYGSGNSGHGSLFEIKNAIITMAVFGPGNEHVQKNERLIEVFEGFQDKLREVLPRELGFDKIEIQTPEVILVTRSGRFMVDAASGGVVKIFEIVWQLYIQSLIESNCVITMDEPENHLHPSMQKALMPSLLRAFPRMQFIVATHSPFIVNSARESNIFVLRHERGAVVAEDHELAVDEDLNARRVYSEQLDTVNRAAAAGEILRTVLGLDSTTPEWANARLEEILAEFKGRPFNQESVKNLQRQLEEEGLSQRLPDAISDLVKRP